MNTVELILLAVFITLVVALFLLAVVEASLLHVRRSAVASRATDGDPQAKRLLRLLDDLPTVMNTVLLTVLLAQVTAAGIAGVLAERWFGGGGITVATVVVTVVLFVYGEAIPKTLAIRDPARYALRLVRPIRAMTSILRPAVSVLVRVADWQSPSSGGVDTVTTVTEGELLHLTDEAAAAGQIDASDAELIERSFTLGDLQVSQILIPQEEIVSVDVACPVPEALETAIEAGHRRLVVHDGDRNRIVGFVRLRDLVEELAEESGSGGKQPVAGAVRDALFVDSTDLVIDVLRRMQAARCHLAVVGDRDEALGMVTVEDIVEELLGEIDEPDPRNT